MNFRTDMAYESVLTNQKDPNIKIKESKHNFGIKRFDVDILNIQGSKNFGKPKGKYITIEAKDFYQKEPDFLHYVAKMISQAVIDCIGRSKHDAVLVVGLGNRHMTADSLGPNAVDNLIITRHIDNEQDDAMITSSLCALSPGVLGITGIETYDIIKGVAEKVNPDIIITVDALASRSTHRLSSAFQVTDTGIVPGAGVGNHRFKLSYDTLGIPVISIGIPLVVYASTLTLDIIDQIFSKTPELIPKDEQQNKLVSNIISSSIGELVVTPKDIDAIVEKCAYVVGVAINLAVHQNLELDEIVGLIH